MIKTIEQRNIERFVKSLMCKIIIDLKRDDYNIDKEAVIEDVKGNLLRFDDELITEENFHYAVKIIDLFLKSRESEHIHDFMIPTYLENSITEDEARDFAVRELRKLKADNLKRTEEINEVFKSDLSFLRKDFDTVIQAIT